MQLRTQFTLIISSFLLAACTGEAPTYEASEANAEPVVETVLLADPLEQAIQGTWRSETARLRDTARHPYETLQFFNIKPDDTVIEIWPGGGWYTDILAPYLAKGQGQLIAAVWDLSRFEGDRRDRIAARIEAYKKRYEEAPEIFGTLKLSAFSAQSGPLAQAGSADAVLTFRNLHNWMGGDYEAKFFSDAYDALKQGGILGIVEHRLPSASAQDPRGVTGYVHEDYVRALASEAGFTFIASSDINANPADTADHPFGVWTLPPTSRTQDRNGNTPEAFDPDLYRRIGESDRMTLKFVKPEKDG